MKFARTVVAALTLLGCSDIVSAELPPRFSVEAGDGSILFDNVDIRGHVDDGATLFNAVAVNRTGCDFGLLEIDLVFVTGEGDRIKRVGISNFRNGAVVPLPERRVPVPWQEVQAIHGIQVLGPMVCAKAVAAEKLAREYELEAARKRLEEATEARLQVEAEKAARIGAVKSKRFKTGYGGLFLGMTADDIRTLALDNAFPWRPESVDDAGMVLGCKAGSKCNVGCDRPDGTGTCCEVDRVVIGLVDGKSVSMTFQSPPCPASRIETDLKKWGDRAASEMTSRYGKATSVSKSFRKIGDRDFRAGKPVPYATWNRQDGTFRISGSTLGREYRMNLSMEEPSRTKERPKKRGRER
ncbi:MAG TPA: hypothetical protein VIU29_03875 [Candidatus Deferrimicrobiaceae bacterium]